MVVLLARPKPVVIPVAVLVALLGMFVTEELVEKLAEELAVVQLAVAEDAHMVDRLAAKLVGVLVALQSTLVGLTEEPVV